MTLWKNNWPGSTIVVLVVLGMFTLAACTPVRLSDEAIAFERTVERLDGVDHVEVSMRILGSTLAQGIRAEIALDDEIDSTGFAGVSQRVASLIGRSTTPYSLHATLGSFSVTLDAAPESVAVLQRTGRFAGIVSGEVTSEGLRVEVDGRRKLAPIAERIMADPASEALGGPVEVSAPGRFVLVAWAGETTTIALARLLAGTRAVVGFEIDGTRPRIHLDSVDSLASVSAEVADALGDSISVGAGTSAKGPVWIVGGRDRTSDARNAFHDDPVTGAEHPE